MKLKLTTLVVEDLELTKKQYLHHNTTASTPTTTTTATKAKTPTINSAPTATTLTTGATTTNKLKGIKAKISGNIVTILNKSKNSTPT